MPLMRARHTGHATLLAVVACAILPACAGVRREPPVIDGSPGARGPFVGLELMTWTVVPPARNAPGGTGRSARLVGPMTIDAAVAPYRSRPVPVSLATLETWASCGLGVVSVPKRELNALREKLALTGGVQSQQVVLSPRWVRACIGPRSAGAEVIELEGQIVRVDRGAVAMLVRSWPEPASSADTPDAPRATACVQVVPQVVSDVLARDRERTPFAPSGLPAEEDKGQVLARLMLDAVCDGADALVIYPVVRGGGTDAPPVRAQGSTPPAGDPQDDAPNVPERLLVPRSGIGPESPPIPLLGEAMLTPIFSNGRSEPRTMLIIVPHPPSKFQLVAVHASRRSPGTRDAHPLCE